MTGGLFIAILLIGVPISFVLMISAAVYVWLSGNQTLYDSFMQQLFSGIESYGLLAIPLFMLPGERLCPAPLGTEFSMAAPEADRILSTTPMTADDRWPPARLWLCPVTHPRTNVTASLSSRDSPSIAGPRMVQSGAGTRCQAHERDSLERLCRCIARPTRSHHCRLHQIASPRPRNVCACTDNEPDNDHDSSTIPPTTPLLLQQRRSAGYFAYPLGIHARCRGVAMPWNFAISL